MEVMPNPEHLNLLLQQATSWKKWKEDNRNVSIETQDRETVRRVLPWNAWRDDNPNIKPDLSTANLSNLDLSLSNLSGAILTNVYLNRTNINEANLTNADLRGADVFLTSLERAYLSGADFTRAKFSEGLPEGRTIGGVHLNSMYLRGTKFREARLYKADFFESDLTDADFTGATLTYARFCAAKLVNANLSGANLEGADFSWANLSGATLAGADLRNVHFVETNLEGASIAGSNVYGISAWNVTSEGLNQSNLVITPDDEPAITVDSLEVAQFIYLLLNNRKIRDVIDTIGKKAVLILGRFTPERKQVLDGLREALRGRGYLPILFDFDAPASRDITETVSTLAHLSRFIIADITDAKSIPQELLIIVPHLPSVPVQPLLLASQHEYGMFEHFKHYPWVLKMYLYRDKDELLASLTAAVIEPAEAKANELTKKD